MKLLHLSLLLLGFFGAALPVGVVSPASAAAATAAATAESADNSLSPDPAAAAEAMVRQLQDYPASIRAEELRVDLLLRAIGRQAGFNVVVAENVTDTISLDIVDLTLYEVFRFVMETRQLHYRKQNNILLVEKKSDFQARRQDLLTVRYCTRYAKAEEHLAKLSPLLAPGGSITVTGQGNCLIVKDQESNIANLEQMLTELDQPVPQVHIEARIVTVTNEAKRRLGVIWNHEALWKFDDRSRSNPVGFSANLPVLNPTSSFSFGLLRDRVNLGVTIQAMQEENILELLSSPSILVLNGHKAKISQGKEVPYTTQSSGQNTAATTTFREASLKLEVTPQVIQDEFISLKVDVSNDSIDTVTGGQGGNLLINKQEIDTNLFLENGATVAIGGIILQNRDSQSSGVPGLSAVPVLGHLFKGSRKSNEQTELMVFLTPTIVKLGNKGGVDDGIDQLPAYTRTILSREEFTPQSAGSRQPPVVVQGEQSPMPGNGLVTGTGESGQP